MMAEQFKTPGEGSHEIALANQLLTRHPPGTREHERGLEMLHGVALTDPGSHARWLLGAYFLQVSSRPQAHAQAFHWLGAAAAEGIPPAVERLADLHLSGLAGERSVEAALALQLRLADQGFRRAAWEAAYLLSQLGQWEGLDAASVYVRACALGYPPAYYSLGRRFVLGDGVERDIGFGRALLRRAADGGYIGAVEFLSELPGAESDEDGWYARLKENLHVAHPAIAALAPGCPDGKQVAHPAVLQLERHLVSIGHPAFRLDPYGRAGIVPGAQAASAAHRAWNWLSRQPRVATCKGFASTEECMHLVNKVGAALKPAADYRRGNSENENAELASFNGRGHPIGALHTDSVTRMLEHRVSMMTQWPVAKLEPCSIICYRPGEEYKPHTDFFTDEQMLANERTRRDFGGQRVATFLLYLKAPYAGGETSYMASGLDIAGEDGTAVLHYNVDAEGNQEPASVHAGRPIISGEKWLWRSTLRQNSLYAGGQSVG